MNPLISIIKSRLNVLNDKDPFRVFVIHRTAILPVKLWRAAIFVLAVAQPNQEGEVISY
jgi:hypothetical protein